MLCFLTGEALVKFAITQKLSHADIWTLTYEMCKGLAHLADLNIIHFDIKRK